MSKKVKVFDKKLIHETVWSSLARGTTFVLFLLANIYLARKLGVHGFGDWSFFFSIITIFSTIAYFGINASTNVFVARNNNTDKIKSVFKDALLLRTKVSILCTIAFMALAFPISRWLNKPEYFFLLLVASPFVLFKTFVEFFNELFQGLHKLKYQFFINLSEFGLNLVFSILALEILISMDSVIYAFVASSVLTTIVGLFFFNSFYKSFDKPEKKEKFQKAILRYAVPLIVINFGSLLMTEVDTIMLGFMSTEAEVGIYSAAKNIINKLPQISYALSMGTMQIFAKLTEKNKGELREKFNKLILINSSIYVPIVLVLLFFGNAIMKALYGVSYIRSAILLQLLAPWVFMASQNVFQNYFMNYQEKAWTRATNYSIAIVLNIILNSLLIPKYGAVGAAIATTISYSPYFIANWKEVRTSLK